MKSEFFYLNYKEIAALVRYYYCKRPYGKIDFARTP